MKKLNKRFLLCISILLASTAPIKANETSPIYDVLTWCEQFSSYMIDDNYRCIDLSRLTGGDIRGFEGFSRDQYWLQSQFTNKLESLGVPVTHSSCEDKPNTLGYYNPASNTMVICELAKSSPEEFLATLIHESWHVVQDCLGGFKNSESIAVSARYPDFLPTVISQSTLENWVITLTQYPDEQQVGELEARFMEDYPEAVLKSLDICESY